MSNTYTYINLSFVLDILFGYKARKVPLPSRLHLSHYNVARRPKPSHPVSFFLFGQNGSLGRKKTEDMKRGQAPCMALATWYTIVSSERAHLCNKYPRNGASVVACFSCAVRDKTLSLSVLSFRANDDGLVASGVLYSICFLYEMMRSAL